MTIPTDQPVVLVVDDDEMARGLAAAALLRAGFTVTLAVGGQQAVEVSGLQQGEVAVVLLGVQMPGLGAPRTPPSATASWAAPAPPASGQEGA